MLRLRFVPAFFCVALAHAALLAVLLSTAPEPAPRRIHADAIVAVLLSPEPSAAHIAGQAAPNRPEPARPAHPAHLDSPSPAPELSRTLQPHAHMAAQTSSPIRPPLATASATRPNQPAQPKQPTIQTSSGAQNPSAPHAATTESTTLASTAPPAAREMMSAVAPKPIAHADCRIPKPVYPELSKRREETGTASVRFIIETTGAIDKVSIAESSGFPRLDDAAVRALREATCQPYVENGSPIPAAVVEAFKFDLTDD